MRGMTSRVGARLAALLVPAALLLPAAAHAQTASFDDATTDAKAVNVGVALGELFNGTAAEGPYFLDAPAETSTDIVRTTIDHAEKRLTLTVQFRPADAADHSVDFRIVTPQRGRYTLLVGMSGGNRARADLFPSLGVVTVIDGDKPGPSTKPCRTVRARYDLEADTLTASAPTACLGTPSWVQVSALASRFKVTPVADGSANLAAYADDAFRGGLSTRSLGRSPRVRRG